MGPEESGAEPQPKSILALKSDIWQQYFLTIFLRIICPNAARYVVSVVWAFEVVIRVSRQIEWLSILYLRAPKSWWIARLIFRTEPNQMKKSNEETKNKNRDAQNKRPVESVLGQKVCERGRSWAGSERERVMDGESGELT